MQIKNNTIRAADKFPYLKMHILNYSMMRNKQYKRWFEDEYKISLDTESVLSNVGVHK